MYHHKKSYISSKPASRLARRRPPSQFWSNAKKFIITYKNILLALVIVFLAATILNLAYNYTIGKPENTVTEVVFSEDARLIYNEPGLYSLIEKEVK